MMGIAALPLTALLAAGTLPWFAAQSGASSAPQAAPARDHAVAPIGLRDLVVGPSATQGDSNKGDIFVDNVDSASGPGHETDPHLRCVDINLYGSKLADRNGTFTIDGWPPSGRQEQDYPRSGGAPWSYNTGPGAPETQVIAVIPVKDLIDNAAANGDRPVRTQGYHFKVQLVQDPKKSKTFWVRCAAPNTGPTPTPLPTSTPTGTSTSSSTTSTGTSSAISSSTTSGASSSVSSATGGVSGSSATQPPPTGSQSASTPRTGAGPDGPFLLGIMLLGGGVGWLGAVARRVARRSR